MSSNQHLNLGYYSRQYNWIPYNFGQADQIELSEGTTIPVDAMNKEKIAIREVRQNKEYAFDLHQHDNTVSIISDGIIDVNNENEEKLYATKQEGSYQYNIGYKK